MVEPRRSPEADPPAAPRRSAFYTIFILCHASPRLRELRLSRRAIVVAATLVAVLCIAGLSAPQLTLRARWQAERLARLELENRRLQEERNRFDDTLNDVQARLAAFEGRALMLARELGLEDLEALDPAVGGPSGIEGGDYWFDGELGALGSRAESLDASLAELGDAFAERTRRLAATPSAVPVDGWFSHGFGWRQDPWTGEREFHHGIDIVAPLGSEVRAVADGVVTQATRAGNYGKLVELAHGYGFVTRYAHMHELGVAQGSEVRRGQVIGRVGSTGRSTGPHLHYEIFRDGKRVNPWGYLDRDARR
jgi:murein DD-endopeptidase MepM/ murein hydrolase activator NlpD